MLTLLLTLSVLLLSTFPITVTAFKCRKVRPLSQICNNPPVELSVDLTAYTGRWHQIFTSGSANRVSRNSCVTANYTLASTDPLRIDVLNCGFNPEVNVRPSCVRANATRRPDAKFDTQLQVRFFTFLPPGKYNIVALLGDRNFGYQAAAVYSCEFVNGKPVDGFFLIARSPYAPFFIMKRLIRRLRCNGYHVNYRMFQKTVNDEKCEFITPPNYDFDVRPPVRIPRIGQ